MKNSNSSIISIQNIKNISYKIIFIFLFVLLIFIFLSFNKVYAANAKLYITPTNPRVGDTFTVNAEITGNDCYSINFIYLDESSNLEYISMDAQKKATDTTPLTGFIKATYKVKEHGTGWISLKYKVESAPLVNKELDIEKITSQTFEKKIDVKIVPKVTGVTEIEGQFEVIENDVNIRPHPSTTYSSLGVYKKGKEVIVTGESGDWYQFTYEDSNAYIHKDYLKEIVDESEITDESKKIENDESQENIDEEEIKDSKVKDPRDYKDNTFTLILVALIIGGAIIVALIYLFKQGSESTKDNDLKYGAQNIQAEKTKFKDFFKNKK